MKDKPSPVPSIRLVNNRIVGDPEKGHLCDPLFAVLPKNVPVENVKTNANKAPDPDQNLGEFIFDEKHPFHSIKWFQLLDREDITALDLTREAIIEFELLYRGKEAYLSDRVVLFYLTYVAAKSDVRTVVVSPQFTAYDPRRGGNSNAWKTTTGARRRFQVALIPIQRADHWTLAIYDSKLLDRPVVYYFDPKQNTLTEEIRGIIAASLRTISMDGQELRAEIREASNPDERMPFNAQEDGVNCGVHVCLIAKRYVLHNRQTFVQDLDIMDFRKQIRDVCKIIRGGILLQVDVTDDTVQVDIITFLLVAGLNLGL